MFQLRLETRRCRPRSNKARRDSPMELTHVTRRFGVPKAALDATFQRAFSARRLRACRVFDRHPSPQHGNCIDNCKDESRGCYQDLQEGDARYLRHGRVTFR